MALDGIINATNSPYESNIFATTALPNIITIHDDTTTSTNSATTIPSCPLLDLPPEIKKMIWSYVLQGDSTPIHVDHLHLWRETEWCSRLNLTLTNKQIRHETTNLFHALNTFVFAANARRKNYAMVENIAEWLAFQSEDERKAIKRVVVCTKHSKEVLEFAWQDAGYCGMDSGFVVGERIDRVVSEQEDRVGRKVNRLWEAWGREEGHFCNKGHYELVRKGG